jgi:two-component system, OmpR family, alkaline phosphatase synthesis response regulator PhoP
MNTFTPKDPKALHVLIVEDSLTQAELLRNCLAREGYAVTVANNGVQALAAARRHPPALIVTHEVNPDIDG